MIKWFDTKTHLTVREKTLHFTVTLSISNKQASDYVTRTGWNIRVSKL